MTGGRKPHRRGVISLLLLLLPLAPAPGLADQVLRVGLHGLPRGLGNPLSSMSFPDMQTWTAIFDGLTVVDGEAHVLPALAISWESLDELTWHFKLRRGVQFSNGEPFDARAVVATIDYITSKEAAHLTVAREFLNIGGARVVDEYTVEIFTRYPTLILPAMLAGLRIIPPIQWQRLGPEGFAQDPAGTGPFKLDTWQPAKVTLSAFAESWRAPKLDRLEIYENRDPSARLQGIQSGSLDIALSLTPDDREELERTGDTLYVGPGGGVDGMAFITVKDSPIRDKRVRQALNYAVDKQIIVDTLLRGHTRVAGQPAPRYVHGHNPEIQSYPYDPQKAKTLLAEAGYPKGFDMIAEVMLSGSTASAAVYSVITEQLAAVDVRLEVRNVPGSQLLTKAMTGSFVGEAFGMRYDFKPTLDALRAIPSHSCIRAVPWNCDPAVMPLIEDVQREFDPERRLKLLREIMRIYHEDATMLYIAEAVEFDGLSKRVRNYAPANGIINYHEIELVD